MVPGSSEPEPPGQVGGQPGSRGWWEAEGTTLHQVGEGPPVIGTRPPGSWILLPPPASQTGPSPMEPSVACCLCPATQLEPGHRGHGPCPPCPRTPPQCTPLTLSLVPACGTGTSLSVKNSSWGLEGDPFTASPLPPQDTPDSPDGLAPVTPQRPPNGLHVRLELGEAGLPEEGAVVSVLAGSGQAEVGHC